MLKIASYNLHKCRGMTGPHAPKRNLEVIAALAPDIIALQEVDFRLGARPEALPRGLIAEATGLVPADIVGTTSQNSLGWHGQTILMRPELAEAATVRRMPLPGIEPRGAIALRLPKLTIIGLHLGLARSSRRAQLARITAQASRIAEDNIVMLGDFNEWRDDRGLELLAGFRRDRARPLLSRADAALCAGPDRHVASSGIAGTWRVFGRECARCLGSPADLGRNPVSLTFGAFGCGCP